MINDKQSHQYLGGGDANLNNSDFMEVVMTTSDVPTNCGDSIPAPSHGGDVEEKMETDDAVNEIDDKPAEILNDVSLSIS